MTRRTAQLSAVILAVLAAVLVVSVAAFADDEPQPVDFTHNPFNAPAPVPSATFGSGPAVKTGTAICTTAMQTAAQANTDCETTSTGPHNETSIAVNPTNVNNMVGGANDYQLGLNPGGHVSETVASRAHVTFDGGKTWSMYPIFSNSAYQGTGDPALAFDASGHAYYGTLGFRFVGPANATNPDVLVSNSGDGGKTWSTVRVAAGSGTETSVGDLLDKEYVAAWGNGNAIVTYGDFRLGQKGSFISAKIYDSITHDFGKTWSTPQVISGSLDEAFVSTPVVAADGRIYVSFLNTTDLTTGRDDYEVVEVSPSTGTPVNRPGQGRNGDRRGNGLPDRARPADVPGQHLPLLGRGQHRRRPDEREASCGRLVGHAEQHDARSEQPVRGEDELRPRREPVLRQRPYLVRSGCDRAAGRPVPVLVGVRHARIAPRRSVRSIRRREQSPLQLLAVDGGERRLADVRDDAGLNDPVGSHDRRPLVRGDAERELPVRHVVPRRLQRNRDHPGR